MNIRLIVALLAVAASGLVSCSARTSDASEASVCCGTPACGKGDTITVGAARTDLYAPMLKGKRVALLSNHTGLVGNRHTLDVMLDAGIDVTTIFSPEHGFRGNADAGEHVGSGVDAQTGIPIASLYDGKSRKPSKSTMDKFDVIVVDIQDVGLRYYTYYITMLRLMNAAAEHGKGFIVLDRPNPNGMTVDGPILDMTLKSGVGALPIPVVHGMTLGELALMINGEGWLDGGRHLDSLEVVPVDGYTHNTRYELPVAPSPNLRSMRAIYLYPSTCYFEATDVSLGRGTDMPFEVCGHPRMTNRSFSFTPRSMPGAKNPPQMGKECHGVDLQSCNIDSVISRGVDLSYLIDAYRDLGGGDSFFTSFFEKLIGNRKIRRMIIEGKSADEIRATWAEDVENFRKQRRPYLIYPE